ncbi:Ribonuclease H-like superfamily protein [Theobroma cacao]|uniref:Ribonuclease H-like superfamily protein n=1 Tax=Theobroma cacao TaxID=3641 RepID=A0A061FV07_THECC|nr:Ribonuclease H-like superfamily protein [Theobroma cacao]
MAKASKDISGIEICRGGSNVTHLLFADDCMLFGKVKRYIGRAGNRCLFKFSRRLGFRDTRCFNLALLAKQGWRLQMQQPTLAYKILKARYFPRVHFMDAPVGSNPSYLWRSIKESQQIIKKGLVWRVGNGNDIQVLEDSWIPYETPRVAMAYEENVSNSMMVSELIDARCGKWDEAKVKLCFPLYESNLILSIPLSVRLSVDRQVRVVSKHGQYTVKFGYRLISSLLDDSEPGCSSDSFDGFWKEVWKLSIPRKIIFFMWKALKGALPTKKALSHRKINVDNICVFCQEDEETDFHILCYCQFARATWLSSKWGFRDTGAHSTSVFDWIFQVSCNLGPKDVGEIACILWAIWKARNLRIFGNQIMNPVQVLKLGLDMNNQYHMAMEVSATENRVLERENRGFRSRGLTLHSDAAMDQVDGTTRVGAGFIIRRLNGGFFCAVGRKIQYCASVEEVELRALVWALSYCVKEQIMLADVFLDNQVVTGWIKKQQFTGALEHLIEDCTILMERINCQAIDFCSRETNRTAHSIAQIAKRMMDEMIEWKDSSHLPVLIQEAVDNDRVLFLRHEG